MEEIRAFAAGNVLLISVIVSVIWFVLGVLLGSWLSGRKQDERPGRDSGQGDDKGSGQGRSRQGGGGCELYVGNLSFDMDDAGLKKLLDPFGNVVSARIITNRLSGSSKGYGFAKMSTADEVKAAIGTLNNKEIEGRRISVSEARTRPRGRRG